MGLLDKIFGSYSDRELKKIRPENFGRAGRISGVSPADIAVLMIAVEGRRHD